MCWGQLCSGKHTIAGGLGLCQLKTGMAQFLQPNLSMALVRTALQDNALSCMAL